jgi:hypothetical protein
MAATTADRNTADYIQYAERRRLARQPYPPEREADIQRGDAAPKVPVLLEGAFDMLHCRPLPSYLQDRQPPLPSLLSFQRRSRKSKRVNPAAVPKRAHGFAPVFFALLLGFNLLVLVLCSPSLATEQPPATVQEYHDYAREQIHALVDGGCVKATEYCLGLAFTMTKYPGGGELTTESYHKHLYIQMSRFTDTWCFVSSDHCLEFAFQAIEPPSK